MAYKYRILSDTYIVRQNGHTITYTKGQTIVLDAAQAKQGLSSKRIELIPITEKKQNSNPKK